MGTLAKSSDLLKSHRKFMERLVALVPGAKIKETPSEANWGVSLNGSYIKINVLVATQARRDGWLEAIKEFQAVVMKGSEHNE